jgi:hypothetical protein
MISSLLDISHQLAYRPLKSAGSSTAMRGRSSDPVRFLAHCGSSALCVNRRSQHRLLTAASELTSRSRP